VVPSACRNLIGVKGQEVGTSSKGVKRAHLASNGVTNHLKRNTENPQVRLKRNYFKAFWSSHLFCICKNIF